jgi:bacterioferritin-associated ferredoxin
VIVCHCRGISEHAVRRAVRSGARTRGQIARHCGAGAGCGGCDPALQAILESELACATRPVSTALGELAPTR